LKSLNVQINKYIDIYTVLYKIDWFSKTKTMEDLKEADNVTREKNDVFAEKTDKSYLNERLLTTTSNAAFRIEGKPISFYQR
jgi:hypothetical protein